MADVLMVYWSGTGNTEIMAEKIKEGIEDKGLSVSYQSVETVHASDVVSYDKLVFGCPSMGVEILEEEDFEPFFSDVESLISGKKVALFGSYGWGDGEWMDLWEERVTKSGASLFEKGLTINTIPSSEEEDGCFEFGQRFADF